MRYLLTLLAVLCNMSIAIAQIEWNDSTSGDWGNTGVDTNPSVPGGKVTSVTLSENSISLQGGERHRLTVAINSDAANKSVIWSSSDDNICVVDAVGNVTALNKGTATVTVTAVDGGLSSQCEVNVLSSLDAGYYGFYLPKEWEGKLWTGAAPPDDNAGRHWYEPGYNDLRWQTFSAPLTNFPGNIMHYARKTFNVVSKADRKIYVRFNLDEEGDIYINGHWLIRASMEHTYEVNPDWIVEGENVICCTVYNVHYGSCLDMRVFYIMNTKAEELLLDSYTLTIAPGETHDIKTTFVPVNTAVTDVEWKVADPSVLFVTQRGKIFALKPGQTTVTATTVDGSNLSKTCTVTVTDNEFTLSKTAVLYSFDNNKGIYWRVKGMYLDDMQKQLSADINGREWMDPDYDDSAWDYVNGAVSYREYAKTLWTSNNDSYIIRIPFPKVEDGKAKYWLRTNIGSWGTQSSCLYINGKLVLENMSQNFYISSDMLRDGMNVIAISVDVPKSDGVIDFTFQYERLEPLKEFSIDKALTLKKGEFYRIVPEYIPANTTEPRLTWKVANPDIVYVDASGQVTGLKTGTTTVTATSIDRPHLSQTVTVTVTGDVKDDYGYSGWLIKKGFETPWTANAKFYTDRFAIPEHDANDNYWYAEEYDDSQWDCIYGPVGNSYYDYPYELLQDWEGTCLVRFRFYLPEMESYDLNAFYKGYGVVSAYVNGKVLTNVNGEMAEIPHEYLNYGGENLFALYLSQHYERIVDFGIHYERSVPVSRLLFRQKQLTMARASSAKLEAIVKPAEATRQSLLWSSSDETVAVVHQDGTVTSLRSGTAIITATTTDGTNLSAQCAVTVTDSWGEEKEVTVFPYCRKVLAFHQSRDKGFLTDDNGKSFSELGFDETGWEMCRMPFATKNGNPDFTLVEETNQRYFVRQHFTVPDIRGKYVVRVHCSYRGYLRVYCNGTQVGDVKWNEYNYYDIPADLIKYGEDNVIAISIDSYDYVQFDNMITLFKIVPVASVTLSETSLNIDQGELKHLAVTVLPDNAYNRKVKWASSEPTIASVDQNGNVTGMGEGKATITATSVDGTEIVASCEVTVSNMKAVAIWIKDCGQNSPWNAKYQYCRTSDDLYVYGPENDGSDRAWTAKDYDDSAWGTIKGPIGHNVDHYETFWPDYDSRYYLRETFTVTDLASYIRPQLFLAHDDGVVVWVNGTKVHEQGDGNMGYYVDIHEDVFVEGSNVICIQVSEGGGSAYIDYGVSMTGLTEVVPVSGITLDKTTLALKRNEKAQLTATISPDNAFYKDVEWTSSDPEIVTVDEEGNIRGISAGEAVITVNNKHGKLFAATCKVTVTNEIAPVKVGEWVIAKEDEWQAKILSATIEQALFNSEPAKDADGNKWTDFNYDDAKWTEIISPMDKNHGYFPDNSRYYVRSKFAVGDLSAVNSMRLWMAHDDEALVYVNGILVACFEGAGTGEISLPTELFVKGDNIICVNIHQGGGDAYLDFALMGSGDEAPKKVSGISFDQETYTMSEGKRRKILPTITPQNVFTDEMVWSSSNPAVAKVADDGTVTAVSLGMAVISAVPVYGEDGVAASYNVEVIKSTLGGANNLPNVSFEFNYNACEYDEATHAIPNHKESDLSGYNLQLSGNIPTYDADKGSLLMNSICRGWIDKWNFESTSSGQYFYRSGSDDMTVIFKVAPDLDSRSCDFIANRGGGYNYMVRVDGNRNRFYLHTKKAYQGDRSIALTSEDEQVLVVRVNGSGNYILLDNLTTGESLKINGINWGGSNNVFKLFYNDDGEYFMGKFFWVYYSKEYLSDEDMNSVVKYNNDVLPSYIPVESVALKNERMTLALGEKKQLDAKVLPEDATVKNLYWTSDNSDVVKVSADGEVTALREGVATVTARNIMTGIEAQCKILVLPSTVSQELSLSAGWNWISHCISSPVSLGWLASAERIMSQTEENYNDPQLGMVGSINSLMPGKAYKVKTPAALANTISGKLHDLASAPIEMEKGWNWVSYPYYKSMTLQNAIVGAEEGDYIVSHLDGFAEYVDGQWQGTMSSLTSGNGYLYKSSSKKAFEIDLFAQTAPSQAIMNDDTATQPTAMVDARIYPSTLNVIAVLSGDGTEVSGDCQVYAFVDNECRGVGRIINGKYFVTVYGDVAATVKFLVKNIRTGLEYEAEETLTFCEDIVGSVKEPMVLTMTPTAIRRIFDDSRKYKVYSVEGVMVKDGITADKFSELPRGIYIIDGQKVIIE